MNSVARLMMAAGATAMLAGCVHRGTDNVSAGDVAIDSLSATRTAILRVNNASPTTVRIYLKMPGMEAHYVAKALPGATRNWVLDPQMFPATDVSLEMRPEGGTPITVGPYEVNKNETIELTVPANVNLSTATVHKSTP